MKNKNSIQSLMSQNFEESPVSDIMDISTTTTIESQESEEGATSDQQITPTNNSSKVTGMLKSSSSNNTSNIMDNAETSLLLSEGHQNKLNNGLQQQLDNDPSSRVLRLGQNKYSASSHRSEAVNHPLMPLSPAGTDSDSENGQYQRTYNFPDVIPQTEKPLRLANPISSSVTHNFTNNCNNSKQHTTTTNSIDIEAQINHIKIIDNDENISTTRKIDMNNIVNHGHSTVSKSLDKHKQRQRKISVLRAPSPDILSSGDSEQDISQYHATVESDYQTVALISKNIPVCRSASGDVKELLQSQNSRSTTTTTNLTVPGRRKIITVPADILSDDISSLDSISNHSFDDDIEPNLASLSPSSSLMDDDFGGDAHDDFDDDFGDLETPTNQMPADPIPQYSAEDERRDSRLWQKITLPDGKVREIDMKVIEPYKRVLSHGGYLKAGGHNAIVMFCACHLPDKSRADYHYVMDNLFLYVIKTLEQLVTEDYVLVYLHGGSSRRNVPPFPWLKKCYQLLDRRLRKSLKNLYLVHPTFWLKSVVWMTRPFVSSKFWKKLVYVRTLEELYSLVSVEKTAIPDKVKNYDAKYK